MSNKEDRSDIAIGGRPRRRSSARLALLAVLGVVLLGGSTAVSYYVDALWFESLGFASVFWTRISLQAATFGAFALVTFLVVFGVFRALKPNSLGQLIGATILVNRHEPRGRRSFDLAHELFHVLTWDAMPPERIESLLRQSIETSLPHGDRVEGPRQSGTKKECVPNILH